jgi:phage terminase Nu1 subunit (DNA packaging protein)
LDLNYFSYFSEIEDTFIRRRGKHLMLSPIDWALIESWKERGVPLHVVLRAIEHAFDSYESKKHKRTVKTLLYCQEEVEAQYAEWLESRVGSHHDEETTEDADDRKSIFSRDIVLAHLDKSHRELNDLATAQRDEDELADALKRAANLLTDIRDEYANAARPDTRKLEESLSGIDRMLDDGIRNSTPLPVMADLEAEVDAQVKPYKRHMDKEVFAQTRENLLKKRLREHFGVPRLSLFFLHT